MLAFVHETTSVFLEAAAILQDKSTLTCNLRMTSMEELSGFVYSLLMELIGKVFQITLFSYSLSFNEIGRICFLQRSFQSKDAYSLSKGDVKQCLTKIM